MKKTLLEIYALAVCFITVTCFVIVLGMAIWNVVEISAPEFTLETQTYEQHQTDEAFLENLINQYRPEEIQKTYQAPEGEALTTARQASYVSVLRSERRGAMQSFLRNLIILVIDLVVFIVHWKVAANARKAAS